MLLVVDIGNTNSVFAVHDGSGVAAEWRCETAPRRTADEYFVWLRSLMAHSGPFSRRYPLCGHGVRGPRCG